MSDQKDQTEQMLDRIQRLEQATPRPRSLLEHVENDYGKRIRRLEDLVYGLLTRETHGRLGTDDRLNHYWEKQRNLTYRSAD